MQAMHNWLSNHYGLAFNSCTLVVYDGNSMTVGLGVSVNYPLVCGGLIGRTSYISISVAISGYTTTQLASDASVRVEGLYTNNQYIAKRICCFWEGTNELYFGVSAATAYANIVTYCQARRTAGWKVVILTILPRSNAGLPVDWETSRQTVNANIIANWATFADALADVAADSRIGDAGDSDNTTYYLDKVHMTVSGYAIVAPIVAAAIATV
jgi:lysophospholipase L1-like esterase